MGVMKKLNDFMDACTIYFQEIETIEEAWRCETRELVSMVSRSLKRFK